MDRSLRYEPKVTRWEHYTPRRNLRQVLEIWKNRSLKVHGELGLLHRLAAGVLQEVRINFHGPSGVRA